MGTITITALVETRVVQGTKTTIAVHVTRVGAGVGAITLTAQGLPGGINAPPVTIPVGAEDANLVIDVPSAAVQGTVAGSLKATSGATTATTPLPLFVRGGPGTVDTTFGTDGYVLINGISPGNLVVTSTGAAIVSSDSDKVAVRITPAGTIDTAYGTAGFARGPCVNGKVLPGGNVTALTVLKDDTILVGWDHFVARYDAKGKVDTTFSNAVEGDCSVSRQDYATIFSSRIWSIVPRADGDIYLGYDSASYERPGTKFVGVTRLDPNGAVRPAYASGSIAGIRNAAGAAIITQGLGMGVRTDPGSTALNGVFVFAAAADVYGMMQLKQDNTFDAAFQQNGRHSIASPGAAITSSTGVVTRADGTALGIVSSLTSFKLVALTKTGDPLSTFGTNGVAGPFSVGGGGQPTWIAADATGRMLVVIGRDDAEEVRRFTSLGALDATFGNAGVFTITHPTAVGDSAYRAAVAPDGRILLLGQLQGALSPAVVSRLWD